MDRAMTDSPTANPTPTIASHEAAVGDPPMNHLATPAEYG
jgi:hypothetical protein